MSKTEDRKFQRRFDDHFLRDHVSNPRSLIGALFNRWELPGQLGTPVSGAPVALRLSIRDGYVNFYANGQSVAELGTPEGEPRINLSSKYLAGAPFGFLPSRTSGDNSVIAGKDLFMDRPLELLCHIVDATRNHCGAEKCFVEHLQARNANIVEVEMALPGDNRLRKAVRDKNGVVNMKKVAPRMDVVVVHVLTNGQPSLDFWEAKLATNSELRSTIKFDGSGKDPHVVGQLDSYESWMNLPGRKEEVKAAFAESWVILDRMAETWGKTGEARTLWKKLISLRKCEPNFNPRPGIVIANYDPKCPSYSRFEREAKSFDDDRHHDRTSHHDRLKRVATVRPVSGVECSKGIFDVPLPGDRI